MSIESTTYYIQALDRTKELLIRCCDAANSTEGVQQRGGSILASAPRRSLVKPQEYDYVERNYATTRTILDTVPFLMDSHSYVYGVHMDVYFSPYQQAGNISTGFNTTVYSAV